MKTNEVVAQVAGEYAERVERCLDLVVRQTVCSARLQGSVEGLLKPDNSPVTVIDLLHQSQLQQLLADGFAEDGLICEEPRSLQEEVLEDSDAAIATFNPRKANPGITGDIDSFKQQNNSTESICSSALNEHNIFVAKRRQFF